MEHRDLVELLLNQTVMAQGLHTTQILGTVFDGISRHTPEGYAFQKRAVEVGFKQAVRDRDEPFGDFGLSTFKGRYTSMEGSRGRGYSSAVKYV